LILICRSRQIHAAFTAVDEEDGDNKAAVRFGARRILWARFEMALDVTIFVAFHQPDLFKDWDVCERVPLGGSETAALRLGRALKKRGARVQILTEAEQIPSHRCDVFISLRNWHWFGEGLRPGKINYLWCQDDADQPNVTPLEDRALAERVYAACTRVVMLSHYQERQWMERLHLPVDRIFRTTNGIPRRLFTASKEDLPARPPRAYYASTPYRGLALLARTWPVIHDLIAGAELHVFSSMKVYRQQEQAEYLQLYEELRQMPGVVYHGSVGQKELREAAQQCRVLAYPNIFPETSCIAAMEAMAAGCVVAGTALGALPETAWLNPLIPPTGDAWLAVWASEVVRLLADTDYYTTIAARNLVISENYDWDFVAGRWMKQFYLDLVREAEG